VCLGGQLQRSRGLRVQPGVRGQPGQRHLGHGDGSPGTAALDKGNAAAVSLSCASAGNCSAGGFYHDGAGHQQAFVVNQVNGAWGTAEEVPGTAALNKGNAAIGTVSCAPAGTCSAGGSYTDSSGHGQAFVVSQT
jgi:hypothetical protein